MPNSNAPTKTTDRVAMRDGIRLATDIYFPAGHGRFPVVLERTPYGRDLISRSERTAANATPLTRTELAQIFTDAGYAVVFQDNRGRHGSEGRFVKYLSDGEDGFDGWALRPESSPGSNPRPRIGCTPIASK